MSSGTSVKFDASHLVVVVLFGSHPGLAARKDATVEVFLATCHKCSSKLCLLFGPFGSTSLQPKRLHKNHNVETATRIEIMQCKKGEAAKL